MKIARKACSFLSNTRPPTVLPLLMVATIVFTACGGGLRPTLVEDGSPTPEPPLELELAPAPAGTPPLPGGSADIAWEASVDDAVAAWAADRAIAYIDRCSLVTTAPGELCDVETERETVRLLGPNASEIWYVITVEQQSGLDFGTGYRVSAVAIAGQ